MILIIGGAYQGKRDYAKNKFGLTDAQIFDCAEGDIAFGARCLYGLQNYTRWCVQNGVDAVEVFRANRETWQESILICEDIFCGVVPMGARERAWREMTAKLCGYLSAEAAGVVRVFCGLEQVLK